MSRNKLYFIVGLTCLSGFFYLLYSLHYSESTSLSVCIIKNVTGFPCPSCGTTRAIQQLFHKNLLASLQMNPFGIVVAILMTILPIWILIDVIIKKETFFNAYKKTEAIIRTKWLAALLIILVVLNWIWNIKKGL